jgi:hypothetical protein
MRFVASSVSCKLQAAASFRGSVVFLWCVACASFCMPVTLMQKGLQAQKERSQMLIVQQQRQSMKYKAGQKSSTKLDS